MFTEIIVPVDLGQKEQAREAIRTAKLNLSPGGKLVLLHVLVLPKFKKYMIDRY